MLCYPYYALHPIASRFQACFGLGHLIYWCHGQNTRTSHCRSGALARRGSGTDRADTALSRRKAARIARGNRQGRPLTRCGTGKRVQYRRFYPTKESVDDRGQAHGALVARDDRRSREDLGLLRRRRRQAYSRKGSSRNRRSDRTDRRLSVCGTRARPSAVRLPSPAPYFRFRRGTMSAISSAQAALSAAASRLRLSNTAARAFFILSPHAPASRSVSDIRRCRDCPVGGSSR
jgi:hypothetical protein